MSSPIVYFLTILLAVCPNINPTTLCAHVCDVNHAACYWSEYTCTGCTLIDWTPGLGNPSLDMSIAICDICFDWRDQTVAKAFPTQPIRSTYGFCLCSRSALLYNSILKLLCIPVGPTFTTSLLRSLHHHAATPIRWSRAPKSRAPQLLTAGILLNTKYCMFRGSSIAHSKYRDTEVSKSQEARQDYSVADHLTARSN